MLEWHFLKLHERYFELLDCNDPRVVTGVGHYRRQKSLTGYVWGVLSALHSLDTRRMEEAAHKMIVDYNRLSISVGAKAKAKAKAKAA